MLSYKYFNDYSHYTTTELFYHKSIITYVAVIIFHVAFV